MQLNVMPVVASVQNSSLQNKIVFFASNYGPASVDITKNGSSAIQIILLTRYYVMSKTKCIFGTFLVYLFYAVVRV